ncbi:MAG: phosphate butyryltransferase [Spirochaetales bacterium]|jgi:phosphate butyryltransferase|nr:phosphate butyryltransferase [Spirochaetales bacterium]
MGYHDLVGLAASCKRRLRVGVVFPDYSEIFKALKKAEKLCFDFLLFGPDDTIQKYAEESGLEHYSIIEAVDGQEAAARAVEVAGTGRLDLLMKGSVRTAVLMSAVLHAANGIKGNSLLSHIAVFESPDGRFIGVTDGGLNIEPTVEQKADIIRNGIKLFHFLGVPKPHVAVLSGIETVNPAVLSTVDAAALTAMAENGAFPEAVVDGPMAFDLAFNPAACRIKHYAGKIQGNADILVVPEIVCGNVLGKALNHAAGYDSGGVIVGAKIPIVLLSRSDRAQEKFNSLLLAGAMVVV